ncbi:MAG: hydrogenase maturation nickel metallochaperone HypA [Actinobacteria bacterium]|nr:hydrogenase maturation nickel metallochaperone HypA [Actinomycetota bacterium]
MKKGLGMRDSQTTSRVSSRPLSTMNEEWTRLHELSIAESVVQIVSRQADGRRVTKVQMKVGHLRQVVPSALAFSFELVAEGTPVEGAELEMEEVPAVGRCRECEVESRFGNFPLQCRACGGFDLEILRGEELLVESLELEEA